MESLKKSPEQLAKEFEDCINQRMTEIPNLTREAAEMICMPSTKPTDEPTPPGTGIAAGVEASDVVNRRFTTDDWDKEWREYQEKHGMSDEPIGESSTEAIRAYWARNKRCQRIRQQLEDTTHAEELQPLERCTRALVEITGISREKANLACVLIERNRDKLAKETIGEGGDLGEDDIESACISSVMTSQHIGMEKARAVCDRILHPEDFIEYGKHPLSVVTTIVSEADFVAAVERRLDVYDFETLKEACHEVATAFVTIAKFAFLWRKRCRNDRAIAARVEAHPELIFVDFLNDELTYKRQRTVQEYIEDETIIHMGIFSISERRASDHVNAMLKLKGLSIPMGLPMAEPRGVGDLHLKTPTQIRRMSEPKSKTGLDNLYLSLPYGAKEDEDNDEFDLESCIQRHMEDGKLSREEAKKTCEEEREVGGLPGAQT